MILKEVDIATYSALATPLLGVFTSEQWLKIYSGNLKCIGIFKDEKQMIGGFFYMTVKKFGLTFIKLPPYTPHCGLFFISSASNASSRNSFTKDVITLVSDYFKNLGSPLTILAFPTGVKDLQPFVWNNYKVIPNYTYQIDLSRSVEDISANFDSKNRNTINRAQKENIVCRLNTLLPTQLYDFFVEALSTTGANVYKNELTRVFSVFANSENSFSYEAFQDNKLLGVVFCIYDANTCYYLLGGTVRNSGIPGVNNLLVQKCIELAKEKGCAIFDFEGSMLKGVEKFFRGFGGDLVPYFTANKGKRSLEILLKFKKPHIF